MQQSFDLHTSLLRTLSAQWLYLTVCYNLRGQSHTQIYCMFDPGIFGVGRVEL